MKDYSPKRRTAVVFAGTGVSGAYHAGVLRALDESGVKIDLVVGTGVGTLAAAFAAVSGGARLYGKDGFWDGLGWAGVYRLRPAARIVALVLAAALAVFVLPLLLALLAGLSFPVLWLAESALPGVGARWLEGAYAWPSLVRIPYLAALAAPSFVLSVLALGFAVRLLRDRRRAPERLEYVLDARPAQRRLAQALWEVSRGPAISKTPPDDAEIGRRYVGLLRENLGEPGFRELILRAADLDTGGNLPFALLAEAHRPGFVASRGRGDRARRDGHPDAIDLAATGADVLLFDAAVSGLLPPGIAPARRVAFPRGGPFGGQVHRLADGTFGADSGLADALAAGADQVVVVTGLPEEPGLPARRRGPRALAQGVLGTLERQAVRRDLESALRMNRVVATLAGGRTWQDPETGRQFRDVAVYTIRPERRGLGSLELDGAHDPATEVLETPDDLRERGYRDAYRQFVEPVVGAAPMPVRAEPEEAGRLVEL